MGKGVKDASKKTDLLYNEFIVYDVSQVRLDVSTGFPKKRPPFLKV